MGGGWLFARPRAVVAGVLLSFLPYAARAVTPLNAVRYSPDIPVVLGGVTVTPQNVAEDNLAGGVTLVSIGIVPSRAHVTAYGRLANGDQLLSFDTDVSLPGGSTVRPGDIVRFDGLSYSLFFDATARGVPAGVMTDAVSLINDTDVLLSFDTPVVVGTLSADPSDLVRFDGSRFTLFFSGSAVGLPQGLNLDAAFYLADSGHLLLSFDGAGTVGGVAFNPNDVLEYDPPAGTWVLAYVGELQHRGWPPAILSGLYAIAAVATATETAAPTFPPTPSVTPTPTGVQTPAPSATTPVDIASPTVTAAPASPTPTVLPTTTPVPCTGDCNNDRRVSVDELVRGVNIALGLALLADCPVFACNGNGRVTVDCLVKAVNNALNGCEQLPSSTGRQRSGSDFQVGRGTGWAVTPPPTT